MQVVIRTYSGKGARELFDVLEKRKADGESLLRTVRGMDLEPEGVIVNGR